MTLLFSQSYSAESKIHHTPRYRLLIESSVLSTVPAQPWGSPTLHNSDICVSDQLHTEPRAGLPRHWQTQA